MKTNSAFGRIYKLQRHILRTIRSEMRSALGPQPAGLRRYYQAYEREFRGPVRAASKEILLSACATADIILMGDYHTFAQSQKAALRLLRQLPVSRQENRPLALAFEMIPSRFQAELDSFIAGKLSDEGFLQAIHYESNWGFPWEQFKPLLEFARVNGLKAVALNHESASLSARDAHAAARIADFLEANPGARLFVLFGDLHLARGHIPKELSSELRARGLGKRKLIVIFQNSESVYWRLVENRSATPVEVVTLGNGRFCIMNAAPWVKLQSYLEWAGAGALFDVEEDGTTNLLDIARERLQNLAEALALPLPKALDFTVHTIENLGALSSSAAMSGLSRSEAKAVKYQILGNRNALLPSANVLYLASASINSVCEGVAMLAHAELSGSRRIFHEPSSDFFGATVAATLAYFGSKVLNPKRKCSLEPDFRLILEQPVSKGGAPHERAHERLQRRVAKLILRHCQAQRDYLTGKRYRVPSFQHGPGRIPVFLETTRCLGAILGEKLYASYLSGTYSTHKLETLFTHPVEDLRNARRLYLGLVEDLARAPLGHSSKFDLF